MATIRTFFKRTVGQTSSDNNHLNPASPADSPSDTTSTTTTNGHIHKSTNDGSNNSSATGVLVNHNDDSLRHPLLNNSSINRPRRFLFGLIHHPTKTDTQLEQVSDEDICLLDKKLPKELVLR